MAVIIATWNVRGLNSPQKQADLVKWMRWFRVDVLGLLETKLKPKNLECFVNTYFSNWKSINNFDLISSGRILVLWDPTKVDL